MRSTFYRRIAGKKFLVVRIIVLAILLPASISCTPETSGIQGQGTTTPLFTGTPTLMASPTRPVEVDAGVETALEDQTTVGVRISLRAPRTDLDIEEQLRQIAQAQSLVLDQLSNNEFQLVYQYQTVPTIVGMVTREGLTNLRHQPQVKNISLETLLETWDETVFIESATLIQAHLVWSNFGLTGAGVNVALLDTGIDNNHPDLAENIVEQHCFVACANDDSNNAQDDNGHGTHVAGIIVSRGETSPRGIALDVGIVAVRVMDSTGAYSVSDIVAGVDWIVANQDRLDVKIINLGMHGDDYSGFCDTMGDARLAASVERARQAGMIIFAPAGNAGLAEMMSTPACISGVIAVGSTGKRGQLSRASNSSSALDLLAPGELVNSTALGGGQTIYNGTSHASPHAAAVAALMLQANRNLSADEIETILKETGVPTTDDRNDRIRITPFIDALAAVTQVISGENISTAE